MTFSNSISMKTFLLATAVIGLAACDGRKNSSSLEEATFRVESIEIANTTVDKLSEEGLPEIKKVQFKACFLDAMNRSPIELTQFAVSDGKTEKIGTTEPGGCMRWDEQHRVSALQKERMLRIRRTFRGVEGWSGTVSLDLAYNPFADSPELHDLRRFTPADLEPRVEVLAFNSDLQVLARRTGASTDARAYLTDISLKFIDHDKKKTKINNLLTLKPAQLFRLKMQPQFIRKDLKNKQVQLGVKGGKFKLHLVIANSENFSSLKAKNIVAEYVGEVSVRDDGQVVKDILLQVHDTAAILSRNHVLVGIEPAGSDLEIASLGYYSGYIDPLQGNDVGIDLIPMAMEDNEISTLSAEIGNVLAAARSTSKTGLDLLEDKAGMKRDSANAEKLLALADGKSVEMRGLKQSYCEKLYKPSVTVETTRTTIFGNEKTEKTNVLQACRMNPDQWVNIEAHDMVVELHGQPEHVETLPTPRTISISRSISFSKSDSTSKSGSANFGLGISGDLGLPAIPIPKIGPFGPSLGLRIGAGADWSTAVSRGKSKGTSISTGVSEGHNLTVHSDTYSLDATVRRCVVVGSTMPEAETGYYACANKSSRRKFEETYYLVNHGIGNSVFTNEASADSTKWRMTIRGTDAYKAFEKMMTEDNTVLEFSKFTLLSGPNMEDELLPDFKVTQVFPGAVTPAK